MNNYTNLEICTSIDNLESPIKRYNISGLIANDSQGVFHGYGMAIVLLYPTGDAIIDYSYKVVDTNSSTDIWDWGLNRDLLVTINNNIPLITPNGYGSLVIYTNTGVIDTGSMGYTHGTLPINQYWGPGRIYDVEGHFGAWAVVNAKSNYLFKGIAYGTYEV